MRVSKFHSLVLYFWIAIASISSASAASEGNVSYEDFLQEARDGHIWKAHLRVDYEKVIAQVDATTNDGRKLTLTDVPYSQKFATDLAATKLDYDVEDQAATRSTTNRFISMIFSGIGVFAAIVAIVLSMWIFALIDILQNDFKDDGTKISWLLVTLLFPLVGPALYYGLGRKGRLKKVPN